MQVKIRIRCTNPKCEQGMIHDPHCKICNQRIPEGHPWWNSETAIMPCGHSAAHGHLVEEDECSTCEGTTWIEEWRDLEELADQLDDLHYERMLDYAS